jgi:hypothetical protein
MLYAWKSIARIGLDRKGSFSKTVKLFVNGANSFWLLMPDIIRQIIPENKASWALFR